MAMLGAATLPFARIGRAADRPFVLTLIGQCLIAHDLRRHPWPGFAPLSQRLRASDACFSDLEVALLGPRAGPPTRPAETLHTADPVVLDCLGEFGINALATSNNHAYDVGTGGILDTMDALRARGIVFAGTGATLDEAAAPAYRATPAGRLAIVCAAAGMIREGGAATPTRAGVNELRRGALGALDDADVARMIESIRTAARSADVVLAYLHNHLWEQDVTRTADWQRDLARRCIDAGAHLFAAHGPPLLHGVETYRGLPVFHGLGSFIFQTRKADEAYDDPNWESLVVECRFERGRFLGARLSPVQLARTGARGPADLETRGRPSPAGPDVGRATLARIVELSSRLGFRLPAPDGSAIVMPG